MIGVGIVGLGFMGRKHFDIHTDSSKSKVVAVADVDEKKLKGDWGGTVGNIGAAADAGADFSGIRIYANPDELLADDGVKLVDITLPTYLHSDFAIKALEAGKHVLCEKPIALTLEQTDRMLHAARTSDGKFMVAHCIRFWPEYSFVRELLAQQKYGRVCSAVFRRISATPTWSWESWLMDQNKSGGVCVDLHIHDIDYVNYLFGKPAAVTSVGVGRTSDMVDHVVTQYHYDEENLMVVAEGSWMGHPACPFVMSFHIVCEKATIDYNCNRENTLEIYTADGGVETPEVPEGDGYVREIDYFLDCVAQSIDPTVVTPTEAREALQVARAEIESVQSGRRVDIKRT